MVSFTFQPLCPIALRAADTNAVGGWVGSTTSFDAVEDRKIFALPVNVHQTVVTVTDLIRCLRTCIYIHTCLYTLCPSRCCATTYIQMSHKCFLLSVSSVSMQSVITHLKYVNVYAFLLNPLSFQTSVINHSIPFLSFPVQRTTHALVLQLQFMYPHINNIYFCDIFPNMF